VVDVVCEADDLRVEAQVTFTAARILHERDPYGGGVVLFKLRRTPRSPSSPVGRQSLGMDTLDATIGALGAWVFPAFPFDRGNTLDRVGLDRWVVVDLPESVNFYQAVALLRADSYVYPESYLPEDGRFLRVQGEARWGVLLQEPREESAGLGLSRKSVSHKPQKHPDAALTWDLMGLGAQTAWEHGQADGVGIAIVDTGVDTNHLAISPNLRVKADEGPDTDTDGNGIPGDWAGVNFAHLAIVHAEGPPRLALGSLSNVSDWDGVAAGRSPGSIGHGTALAAVAAGAGGPGGRLGVAPQAWILPIDAQENLRTTASQLLEDDPRMQLPPRSGQRLNATLRSSVWARAAGVAYAVRERPRVLTCAWQPTEPYWILHDVLVYAEDNCVLPVCSSEGGLSGEDAGRRGYPARWRSSWLREQRAGNGDVYDAWEDALRTDFFERPLRAMLIAGGWQSPSAAERELGLHPDLLAPVPPSSRAQGVTSAVSNPRNDITPIPDRRTAAFAGPEIWAGLLAGAAALVTAERPDLEPLRVRNALLDGASFTRGAHRVWVPGALEVVEWRPQGSCAALLQRQGAARTADGPLWQRVKIRVDLERPGDDDQPGSASPGLP
jgi:hypothetical protein